MQGSSIYSDFSPEISWIGRRIARDVRSFSPSVRPLAGYYTRGRLKVLGGDIRVTDRRMGRPIPYAVFWFGDALGLEERNLCRLAGLSLVCSSIAITIRDDMVDARSRNYSGKGRLARFWYKEYFEALRQVYPGREGFTKAISLADAEWSRYKRWQSDPSAGWHSRPFSADFLRESSRYYVTCALPSLTAVAYAAGRREEVPLISRFLREYSMGWRIFDDLVDWERDIAANEMNRSSVLIYIRNRMGGKKAIDRIDALSWFMSDEFVKDAYGAMVGFFMNARKAVAGLGSRYLDQFMEEQIRFQTDKRELLLRSAGQARDVLNADLASVLGP